MDKEEEEEQQQQQQQQQQHAENDRNEPRRSESGEGIRGYHYHDGSFGAYMRDKESKLAQQFQRRADELQLLRHRNGDEQDNAFLRGCTVMVNGRSTVPQSQVKDLVLRCGGSFVNYECGALTHVIAEVLPTAKVSQLRKRRKLRTIEVVGGTNTNSGMRASEMRTDDSGHERASISGSRRVAVDAVHWVTTQWLLDSVAAKKRMKEAPYMCVDNNNIRTPTTLNRA